VRLLLLSVGLPKRKQFSQPDAEAEASGCISVVVAINGPYTVIHRCLGSLEHYASRAEVILVDDGCSKEIADSLKNFQARNGWKLIRHDSTLGHSRATEAGARVATRPILAFLIRTRS